jgi:hypothetical protein
VYQIQTPIDGASIRQVDVAEQVESVLENLLRRLDDPTHMVRHALSKQTEPGCYLLRSKEEVPASSATGSPHMARKIETQRCQQAILSLSNLLPQAVAQLGAIHTRNTIRDLFPFSDAHAIPLVVLRRLAFSQSSPY